MHTTVSYSLATMLVVAAVSMIIGCDHGSAVSAADHRTVTVAQSGNADVTGSDSAALQRAANLLKPGDTLMIGPGTYTMNNSLFIPSGVTVKGTPGQTVLKKNAGVESELTEDGDYGQFMLAVAHPEKFRPGMGISVIDDTYKEGWDISVTTVNGVQSPYLLISPPTVRDYDLEQHHARVRNTFPILCAVHADNVVFEDLIVDGNRAENAYIDGCRGGAIYMYCVRNVTVRNCTARNYNGDGISFQISDGVQVLNSESYGHAGYGIHPGTGSANGLVKSCYMHDNGEIGLFLCWRVQHGRFVDNRMERNGQYGISIGHKDTDNEFVNNVIASNGRSGVYFRKETAKNAGNRNTFRNNKVVDNGAASEGYGFYIEAPTTDLVIENNEIAEGRKQRVAIFKAPGSGRVLEAGNRSTRNVAANSGDRRKLSSAGE